jgi:1-acyl-sn-glycerol-3-phosphate acyltransferase
VAAPHGEDWHGLPTLYYSNHVSWWDGYLAFFLFHERWHTEGYLMMEEPQLRRYRFFQRCGCFSVDRQDAREAMRSVCYAASLLHGRPGRGLWIFPQGEIQPNDLRPLTTYSGAAHVARRAGSVRCVPVALRFEFFGEQRPEALIRLGPPHIVEEPDTTLLHADMDRRLLDEVEGLRADVLSGATARYRTALAGHASVNALWDRVRGKV